MKKWSAAYENKVLMDNIPTQQGYKRTVVTDQTAAGIAFFKNLLAKLEEFGPPKMGLNILMGKSTKGKLSNLLAHLENGWLRLESGVYEQN